MPAREPLALKREVPAIQIPSGLALTLTVGSWVTVTQALGGSFTVLTERGQLARIAGDDADALGLERPVEASPGVGEFSEARIWDALKTVYDPEIPASIVDLGLVYHVAHEPKEGGGFRVLVAMTLTAPGCAIGGVLQDDVRRRVAAIPDVREVDVEIVFDPPWDPSRMTEAVRLQLGML